MPRKPSPQFGPFADGPVVRAKGQNRPAYEVTLMTRTDLQAMRQRTLGCYWPTFPNAPRGSRPNWKAIRQELESAARTEADRALFMGEAPAEAEELYRLARLAHS